MPILSNLFERRRKIALELATLDRLIEAEGLRLANDAEKRKQAESEDWTAMYKGKTGKILSAIWNAPSRRLEIEELCEAVWSDSERNRPTKPRTLIQTIWRINCRLKEDGCRYKLESICCKNTGGVKSYCLRKDNLHDSQE